MTAQTHTPAPAGAPACAPSAPAGAAAPAAPPWLSDDPRLRAGPVHRSGEAFLDQLSPPDGDGSGDGGSRPEQAPGGPDHRGRAHEDRDGAGRFRPGNRAGCGGAPIRPLLRTAQIEALMRKPYAYWVAGEYKPMPFAEAFLRRVAEFAMNGDPRCIAEMLRLMGEVEERRREEGRKRAERRKAKR